LKKRMISGKTTDVLQIFAFEKRIFAPY